MINSYYLLQDGQQTGPHTQYEVMDMHLDVHTMILSPLATDWEEMVDLPEFNSHFESRGIYPPNQSNYASFWWRLLAYIIDYAIVILSVLIVAVIYYTILNLLGYPIQSESNSNDDMAFNFFGACILILYHSIFESSKLRGSVGKVICKMCVVDVKGQRLTFASALGRNCAKILSSMVVGIGFLSVLWNKRRQGWHDELAKAYVIRRK